MPATRTTPRTNDEEGDLSGLLGQIRRSLIRRRWIAASVAAAIAIIVAGASLTIRDQYTSVATIIIDEQKVSERYVAPSTMLDSAQLLNAVTEEVLSRQRLQMIIRECELYGATRDADISETMVDAMRRDVAIEPMQRGKSLGNIFRISFTAYDPELARKVTTELSKLFIEENRRSRSSHASATNAFFRAQLDAVKKQLTEQEQRIRDYKLQFLGELPEQQPANATTLGSLENQLDRLLASRNQAVQQRVYLESLINQYRRPARRVTTLSGIPVDKESPAIAAVHRDVLRIHAELRSLETTYTANHPDVPKKRHELEMAQASLASLIKAENSTATKKQAEPRPEAEDEDDDGAAIAQLKSQLQATNTMLEGLDRSEQKVRSDIENYRKRLDVAPVREQQLGAMQRDYELTKLHYADLIKKEQDSDLASSVEQRREGQQFRLADGPSLPSVPSSPDRLKISLAGIAAGVFVGLFAAVAIGFRNSPVTTVDDAASRFSLPLVLGVPLILTESERRRRSRRRILESFAAALLLSVVAAVEVYVYRYG